MNNTTITDRVRREWIVIAVTLLSVITALAFYSRLPDIVPPFWSSGEAPDPFNSKKWAAFFPPFLLAAITGFFVFGPDRLPHRTNVLSLWRARPWVRGALLSSLAWIHFLNLDVATTEDRTLQTHHVVGSAGVLMFVVGYALMTHASGTVGGREASGTDAQAPPLPGRCRTGLAVAAVGALTALIVALSRAAG